MLSNLFDEYSLNARVRPSLLVFLPVIIAVYITFPQLYNLATGIISLVVICGFITALAHFSRQRGREVERKLFVSWGGKPTSIMLRHRDKTLDEITKSRYHQFFSDNIEGWKLPSEDEEIDDPDRADSCYDSAIKWLLENTRDTTRYNLLFKENINYGFRRNTYGMKTFGIILSILSIVIVCWGLSSYNKFTPPLNKISAFASLAFSSLILAWWIFVVSQEWVKDSAFSFSARLLGACDLKRTET